MDRIKFNDGTGLPLMNITSAGTKLTFSVQDEAGNGLEEICKSAEKTDIIKLVSVNGETQDETVVKAYAGYNKLASIKTEYDVVTAINYDVQDRTTESGFAEEKHNITTVVLHKPTKTEADLAAIKESLALHDGAIEDIASVVSDIVEESEEAE